MLKHPVLRAGIFGLIIIALLAGCQFMQRLLSDQKIVLPEVTLNRVEVKKDPENSGWWFYADNIEPTKGAKGDHGASLALAFVFDIKNPNKSAVLLDEINFTAKFQNFKLEEIKSSEKMWIPPGKTNQLRIYSLFNVPSVRLNLLVQGGQKLLIPGPQQTKDQNQKKQSDKDKAGEKEQDKDKAKQNWLWRTLEEYWTGIPEFKYPVSAADGTAIFEAKGVNVTVPFNGEFPKSSN